METKLTVWSEPREAIRTNEVKWLIVSSIVGGCLGGSGIAGLFFYFLKRYIEKKLQKVEDDADSRLRTRIARMKIDDELHHAYGRLFFWLYKAVITQKHNGELEKAFLTLQGVEEKKKDLDRQIIAQAENEQS